jgi:hypothetical protein
MLLRTNSSVADVLSWTKSSNVLLSCLLRRDICGEVLDVKMES